MDDSNRLGRWWRPDNPRRRLFGVLKTPPGDSPILEVAGDLAGKESALTILGQLQDERPITLLKCLPISTERHVNTVAGRSAVTVQRFLVHVVMEGGRFKTGPDAGFRCAGAEFSDVGLWLGTPLLRSLPSTTEGYSYVVGIDRPDWTRFACGDMTISLAVGVSHTQGVAETSLSAMGAFDLSGKAPLTLDEWEREYLSPIRHLLSFAANKACVITKLTMLAREPSRKSMRSRRSIPLIEVRRGKPLAGPVGHVAPSPLFTLSSLQIGLQDALIRWLDAHRVLELPLNLYFATLDAPFLYRETRFLYLVQAAEGYHRVRRARRRTKLVDRLEDLAQVVIDQGIPMPMLPARSFAAAAQSARDDLCHGGLSPGQSVKHDFLLLTDQLTTIMRACLLEELGVPAADRKSILLGR
jgi:hypothetical protein